MAVKKTNGKVTMEHFVKCAIRDLRGEGRKGIHTVYSGFNAAFRQQFGDGIDPKAETTKLARKGVIVVRLCKGGAMLYLPDDAPVEVPSGDKALAKINL